MEIDNPRIRKPLTKIIQSIQSDRSLLRKYSKSDMDSERINAENLRDLSAQHLFDDFPNLFGVTTEEAWAVRGYLSGGNSFNYEFVNELHRAYPRIIEEERPEFLQRANQSRSKEGLPQLKY